MRFGRRFGRVEAGRLEDTLAALQPVARLTLDFSDVREFEDAAIIPLARILGALGDARVTLRGLTLHQRRMLKYFGVDHEHAAVEPLALDTAASF